MNTTPDHESELNPQEDANLSESIDKLEQEFNAESNIFQGQIDELQKQVDEQKDKYLRLFAEFDNYKKRTIKESYELRLTAARETIQSMLPVLDDFQRAKKASDTGAEAERFSEGVNLVYQKLFNILESKGLKLMDTNGQVFDIEFHEAITEISAPNEELKGKVIDTIENGYTLNDKIIRYAKVVVGK
jgi:molecular chaperone GrpE